MIFRQYSPNLVKLVTGGILVQMFAKGSKINVAKAEDDFEMVPGCDGDVVLVQNHNPIGSITFRTMAESPSNDQLSARALLSRKVTPVVVPSMVKNLNSTGMHRTTYSVLRRTPDQDYASEAGVIEWVLLCADLEMYVGGALF